MLQARLIGCVLTIGIRQKIRSISLFSKLKQSAKYIYYNMACLDLPDTYVYNRLSSVTAHAWACSISSKFLLAFITYM